jgi:hypothetical protein
MSACTHKCSQGRRCTCAAVQFAADAEGVMPMATGCSLKAPAPVVPPIDRKPRFTISSVVAWGAVLLIFPPLAALCVRLAVRFSN